MEYWIPTCLHHEYDWEAAWSPEGGCIIGPPEPISNGDGGSIISFQMEGFANVIDEDSATSGLALVSAEYLSRFA